MKIICSKNNLLKSVSISLKAVPSKTTMPILECILIDGTAFNEMHQPVRLNLQQMIWNLVLKP